jgi:hypothetical protein
MNAISAVRLPSTATIEWTSSGRAGGGLRKGGGNCNEDRALAGISASRSSAFFDQFTAFSSPSIFSLNSPSMKPTAQSDCPSIGTQALTSHSLVDSATRKSNAEQWWCGAVQSETFRIVRLKIKTSRRPSPTLSSSFTAVETIVQNQSLGRLIHCFVRPSESGRSEERIPR